jgi:hypothetical protein
MFPPRFRSLQRFDARTQFSGDAGQQPGEFSGAQPQIPRATGHHIGAVSTANALSISVTASSVSRADLCRMNMSRRRLGLSWRRA